MRHRIKNKVTPKHGIEGRVTEPQRRSSHLHKENRIENRPTEAQRKGSPFHI